MSTAQIKPVSPTSSRNSAFPPHRVAGQSTPGTVSSHMKGLLVPAAALYDHADTREAKHVINQGRGFCHSQELIVKQPEHVHAHSHHPVEKSRPLISTQTVRAERGARGEGRGGEERVPQSHCTQRLSGPPRAGGPLDTVGPKCPIATQKVPHSSRSAFTLWCVVVLLVTKQPRTHTHTHTR